MYQLLVSISLLGLAAVECDPQGGFPFAQNGNSADNGGVNSGTFPWGSNSGAGGNGNGAITWSSWQNVGSGGCGVSAGISCGGGDGGSGFPFGSGCSRQGSSVEMSTSAMSRLLITVGQKMEQFCTAHSDRALREVYGIEHFQLRVRLSEFNEESIKVRVRQRLVSVHARSCSEEYAAARILPDIVDARRAVWKFEGGTLTVFFPYKVTPDTKLQSRCGRRVDEGIIIVPMCDSGTVIDPDYDVTFGDAKLRKIIKRYLRELAHEGNINENSYDGDSDK